MNCLNFVEYFKKKFNSNFFYKKNKNKRRNRNIVENYRYINIKKNKFGYSFGRCLFVRSFIPVVKVTGFNDLSDVRKEESVRRDG